MIISYDFPAYEPTDVRLIFLITHLFYEEEKSCLLANIFMYDDAIKKNSYILVYDSCS